MRVFIGVLLGLALGLTAAGTSFFASGHADSLGWTWFPGARGQAQWQFYDVPGEGHHLAVEILLQTRGWRTPPPSLSLTLQFFTFSSSVTRRVQLQRIGEKGECVAYFGQVILARRDLHLGSYLAVKLKSGPAGVEIGVHPSSVRIKGETPAGGIAGPLVPEMSRAPFAPPPISLTIRECVGMKDAPYVSPGWYEGELGWPGPGSPPDSQDWLRVNLGATQLLEVRVCSPYTVCLALFDPFGQEVGRVRGSGQIGISYQASVPGAHWICVSIGECAPLFTYIIGLAICR